MGRRTLQSIAALVAVTAAIAGPACTAGADRVRAGQARYNEALRRGLEEELLLNLVRLRYRDVPLFTQAGSVVAQFQTAASAGLSRTEVGGGADATGLDLELSVSEKPTVTFSPLQDEAFVRRLLRPFDLETVVLLQRSGWRLDRVLRLAVQRVNGLDNAARASGPTPERAPDAGGFLAVADALQRLEDREQVALGYEAGRADVAPGAIDVARLDLDALALAEARGWSLQPGDAPDTARVTRATTTLVLRMDDDARASPDGRAVLERLGLDPALDRWPVHAGAAGLPGDAPEPGRRAAIVVDTRSLIGTLFYLSQAVDVPDAHAARGLVTVTRDDAGRPFDWAGITGDLLAVRVSSGEPEGAAVAVPYRGHWFWIDDADLSSKSTFALLVQMFALQAGGAEAGSPVLTLPVG